MWEGVAPSPAQSPPPPRRPRRSPSITSSLLRPSPPASPPAPGAGSHSLQRVAPPVLPPRPGGPSRLADPLHVPVRLVRPGSRVVFSSVILVSLLMDDRMGKRKRLTVTTISGHQRRIRAPITYGAGSSCSTNVEVTPPGLLHDSSNSSRSINLRSDWVHWSHFIGLVLRSRSIFIL
ncbi:MAG: hypothetical protein PWQ69_1396 [Methanomicrobiaceae archaeon]|nr:hypothetical protein [Methanomicrobiaceae archaeon]